MFPLINNFFLFSGFLTFFKHLIIKNCSEVSFPLVPPDDGSLRSALRESLSLPRKLLGSACAGGPPGASHSAESGSVRPEILPF